MKVPSTIYKKFHAYFPVNEMRNSTWFALEKNYGESYGDINKEYRFKRKPTLLDIGNADVRQMIEDVIQPHNKLILTYSDPDMQYSGRSPNKKYHDLVKQYFGDEYDGTFISENELKGNAKYTEGDLIGASEIVIWKDHDDLLEEIVSGGRRKKNMSRKKKRTNPLSKKNKKSKKTQKKK